MNIQATDRNNPWTILKLLNWAASYFTSYDIDSPKSTAEILLSHALRVQRIDLYLQYDRPLNRDELSAFKRLVQRRRNKEPVAYIVGSKEFWSLPLAVTQDVLIPRPDTECLVETALDILKSDLPGSPLRILDLGTGSGAVVLALASQCRGPVYFASDISAKATALAKANALENGLTHVHFFTGDWLVPVRTSASPFDLIVSNPPYIPSGDIPNLQAEISRFEPMTALDAGTDGLGCLRYLVQNVWPYLKPGGHLIVEIGYNQKDDVTALAMADGRYEAISVRKDYGGNDRVVCMKRRVGGSEGDTRVRG
jgi:release factor glutamine methyltransferase